MDESFPLNAWYPFPSQQSWSRPEPLLIGLEAPLSGDQKNNGRDMWRGALLAAEELNRQGGILGRPVKLLRADDQADPEQALSVARRLRRQGADALIGPYNSGVGVINLPWYVDKKILPVHLTSTDDTDGFGVTVQPKNAQIAPVERDYVRSQGVDKVSMLVDPSTFTTGMADRLQAALKADGVEVRRLSITPGLSDYSDVIAQATANDPGLVYVSTYFPEGSTIARQLVATGSKAQPFMGLANVDSAFVGEAGLKVARRCVFSGTPEATQLPTAKGYVTNYEQRFDRTPGVWGTFTYDSMKVLAEAMEEAGSSSFRPALRSLLATRDYEGQTGLITIDPLTGNRVEVPVFVLQVNREGQFVVQ